MIPSLAELLTALVVKPSLILLAGWLLVSGMRRRSAAARHAVWAVAMGGALALPLVETAVPPLRLAVVPAASPPRAAGWDVPVASERAALASFGSGGAPSSAEGRPAPRVPAALFALWVCGAALACTRLVASHVRAGRIGRRARMPARPGLDERFGALIRAAGLRRAPRLRVSSDAASPAVVGVLAPMVVLPAAAESWERRDLDATLVHELGHVARRDGMVDLLAQLACALYWCNPLVWLARRRLTEERERACDDLVLRSGAEPEEYAGLLLSVARAARGGFALPAAATPMARPSEIESRFLAILDPGRTRQAPRRLGYTGFAALGLLVTAPTAALRLEEPASEYTVVWVSGSRPGGSVDSAGLPGGQADSLAGPALVGPDSLLALRLLLRARDTLSNDRARERASWALAQVRDGRLVDPLLDALGNPSWRVQAGVVWALGMSDDPRIVPRLLPLLDSPVWRLRTTVAFALRDVRDPRVIQAIDRSLGDMARRIGSRSRTLH